MKKYLFAMMAMVAFLLTSCSTIHKTATTTPVAFHVEQYPTVTDLDILEKVEVSTDWSPLSLNRLSLSQRKGNLISETLKAQGADVLLEPHFIYTKRGFFRRRTLTLSGYPAKYKGFRKATNSDIEALKATQFMPANERTLYNVTQSGRTQKER